MSKKELPKKAATKKVEPKKAAATKSDKSAKSESSNPDPAEVIESQREILNDTPQPAGE